MSDPYSSIFTGSPEETFQIGSQFGQTLTAPCVIAFSGDLGAGKTTFIRGLASGLGMDEREVCSPTFTYLNVYQGTTAIYHFDLYRIPNQQEFEAAGFDEYLQAEGICCIEWSEKISSLLKELTDLCIFRVSIDPAGEGRREIRIT